MYSGIYPSQILLDEINGVDKAKGGAGSGVVDTEELPPGLNPELHPSVFYGGKRRRSKRRRKRKS